MINTCDTCKYWSDCIARSIGGNEVEAVCLNPDSPHTGEYTVGRVECEGYEKGNPVDG